MKKFLAILLVMLMVLPTCMTAFAAEDGYDVFIAFGGDVAAENDWGFQYYGDGAASNAGEITATNGVLKVGETTTISLEFASPVFNTWFFAPTMIAEGVSAIDFDITVAFDGTPVDIDMAADAEGKTWWYEGTGDYTGDQAVRLAGGWNEWATQYIAEQAGFTKIEYTITLNSIETGAAAGNVELVESDAVYDLFIGFGGDKEAENDWGWNYDGGFADGITATNASIKSGETATISLEFASPVVNAWWFAPCLNGTEDIAEIDATITCAIDGNPVDIDFAAGDLWWAEATGENATHRLAGGFNEWGAHYIAEPAGFTKLEYTIALNSVKIAAPEVIDVTEFLDDDYAAYIWFQTDLYTFRNNWDDATYGLGTENFDVTTAWAADGSEIRYDTTFADAAIVGNGTYTVSATFNEDTASLNGSTFYNMLQVSTNIPSVAVKSADNEAGVIEITDVKTSFDGGDNKAFGWIDTSTDYASIMVLNTYNSNVGTETIPYAIPEKSIAITFTISGMTKDAPAVETPVEETPADDTTAAPSNAALIACIAGGAVIVAAAAVLGIVLGKSKKAAKAEETTEAPAEEYLSS